MNGIWNRTTWHQATFVATVAVLTLFTNLGGMRLWDRDEPRNAGCAREMLERGDWVTPVFNAELRAHKPVLLYWLIMSAYSVLGVNEFAARFWSAALGVGTVMCTYFMGRRLFSPRVGQWSGVILATCLMFGVAGRAATPDSPLIFFSTLAITIFAVTCIPVNRERLHDSTPSGPTARRGAELVDGGWKAWASIYAAMSFAVLAKGPVGLVMPSTIIGLFLLISQQPRQPVENGGWRAFAMRAVQVVQPRSLWRAFLTMRPLVAVAVLSLVALPWYVAVGLRTGGQFLTQFFFEHHLARATSVMEGHQGQIWFYPVAILVGTFPWSVFAAPVIFDIAARKRGQRAWTPGHTLAILWLAVYVGVFSAVRTKLPSYVTPCYPALALIAGCFVDGWARQSQFAANRWPRAALTVYSIIGLAMIIAVPLVARRTLPGEEWLAAIGAIPLIGGGAALASAWKGRNQRSAMVFALSSVLTVISLLSLGATRVDRHRQNLSMLEEVRHLNGSTRFAAVGCLEPSWIFYEGQPIEELSLTPQGNCGKRWIDIGGHWTETPWLDLQEFTAKHPKAAIITTDEHGEALLAALPADYAVVAEGPYFLRKNTLLILARDSNRSSLVARSPNGSSR